jgi:hypothetical protein
MIDLAKELKDYFNSTSQEQLDKDWEELKHWNEIGPEVDEYIKSVISARQVR